MLLIVLWHMPEQDVFGRFNGWTGVLMFFVLSGFLITTLCIREAGRADGGRFDLVAFYIRRACRILPLYVLTVALAAGLIAAFAPLDYWDAYTRYFVYYATMSADFIAYDTGQPLPHLWSLGIEEKFYLLWPLALLVLLRLKTRDRIWVVVVMAFIAVSVPSWYVDLYFAICLGCLLAFVLDDRRGYEIARRLATVGRGALFAAAITLAAAVQIVARDIPSVSSNLYALLTASAIGMLIIRAQGSIGQLLATRPARWIGKRSYGIFLFHPFVIYAADRWIQPDSSSIPTLALRLALTLAASFLAADIAHRTIEVPMIRRGRRIAKERAQRRGNDVVVGDKRAVPAES